MRIFHTINETHRYPAIEDTLRLPRSWLILLKIMVNHGTLVKIMANHDIWNACQNHGKILTR